MHICGNFFAALGKNKKMWKRNNCICVLVISQGIPTPKISYSPRKPYHYWTSPELTNSIFLTIQTGKRKSVTFQHLQAKKHPLNIQYPIFKWQTDLEQLNSQSKLEKPHFSISSAQSDSSTSPNLPPFPYFTHKSISSSKPISLTSGD